MRPRRALLAAPALLVSTLLLTPANGAVSGPGQRTGSVAPTPFSRGVEKAPSTPSTKAADKHAVAVGTGGAVASETVGASRAGLAVLKSGGNAVDAAVATAAALGVDDPFVAGPGGGGFMVIYLAHSKRIVTIDGREKCPARCTPQLFLDKAGKPLDFELARHSGISVGVPGMVAQVGQGHPAVRPPRPRERLAAGDRLGPARLPGGPRHSTTRRWRPCRICRPSAASRKLLDARRSAPFPWGTHFRNPDLAKTYGPARHPRTFVPLRRPARPRDRTHGGASACGPSRHRLASR